MTTKDISPKKGILMFYTLLIAYITFAASWVGGSSLGPQVVATFFGDKGVDPTISEMVNYTITIARVIANFLAAAVLVKLGIKKAAQVAIALLCFAMVAAWMPNYWFYIVARMIMALGGSMIMVYMNPVVVRFVSQDKKLFYSSFITASYNIGAFLIAVAFALWADALRMDWRITLSGVAFVAIVTFVVWLVCAEDFETGGQSTDQVATYSYGMALKDSFVWRFAVGFAAFLILYVMSLNTVPNQLAKEFPEIFQASYMVLAVSGGGIMGTLVRLKSPVNRERKPYLVMLGILAIASMALGIISVAVLKLSLLAYLLFFVSGFLIFYQYAVYLNIPHELPNMNPQKATLMFGIIWGVTYGLYTILNFIWSWIYANMGYWASNIFYFLVPVVYLLMIMTLPETYKKK
ncbi:MFS transporter [Streptococcus sp. sy010]|uniref:MFS transporter n=1 Tax=Streptococcus sp. sy010 TaxID=2600148 RepID=UPI0011B647D9|nr:MFS transporter [Streptococcus sp. sy010]TWT14405.1 MFS transporter [Streptococcus sp. sy010]